MGTSNYIEIPTALVTLDECPTAKTFRRGGKTIIVSQDGGRWHLSISTPNRYPTWDEIKEARYALLPDHLTMAILLPPRSQYVNIHPNCFHLWQIMGTPFNLGDAIMKINKMWAMFDKKKTLFSWTVRDTRKDVIRLVQNHFGNMWRELYRDYGYRVEKVVVLRAEEFEELLRRAEK